ncbi:MAG TPA: hypothetical protein VFV68_07890 [Agriterribacter sp.]|nr:hypothetical protein [Agriterribacter sp.]
MRYRKNILVVTLLIGVFLFFYIRLINAERSAGIQLLFNRPESGDIYKIRYTSANGNELVRYFKLAAVEEGYISFYRGIMSAWNVSDVFLDDFDRDRIERFSREDLLKIKDGSFSNREMKKAILVEIERKKNRVPVNSI